MPMTDPELLARMNSRVPPTAELLGFKLLDLSSERGWVRIEYFAKPEFCNPMGNVQGGIVAAMLDDAAAIAAIVKSGQRMVIPTLEFKTTFFAAAKQGTLYAEGRCLRLGKRVAFMEADLFDPDNKHLARMSVTAMPM
ncbi:MAG: PaaI family thioesterase, partial [Alphaproteobacteria bacterium]|nr:PaaI family thioesterase [Alphaproteobacteria bacterium]